MRIVVLTMIMAMMLTIAGCAGESKRERGLNETLRSYEHTIRWGKLENVNNYLKEPVEFSEESFEKMKHIQVTGYRVLTKSITKTGLKQFVEIRYYNDEYAVERTITDPQTWEYDEEAERWYLVSTVPKFK